MSGDAERDLLGAALAATQLSARRLAVAFDVNERTLRRWQEGQALPGPVRQLCRLLVRHPQLARVLLEQSERNPDAGVSP